MTKRFIALLLTGLLLLAALPAAAAGRTSLTVTVTGAAGAPAVGARVELIAPGVGTVAAATTDKRGRATVPATGGAYTYWIRAWGDGLSTMDKPWVPAADGPGLTLVLTPLRGGISGVMVDQLGVPVAAAPVTVWNKDLGLAAQTVTAADGSYAVDGLAPGSYQVQAAPAGYKPFLSPYAPVAAGKTRQLDGVVVSALGSVVGRVVDSKLATALDGARVELIRKGWGILAATTADSDGNFGFAGVPTADAPDYTVRVWAVNYPVIVSAPFALAPGGKQEFTGANQLAGPSVGVRTRNMTVSGVVEDDQGNPLAGAAVSLFRPDGDLPQATTTTAADGSYSFDDQPVALAGGYAVEASLDGYYAGTDGQTAPAPDNNDVVRTNLRLRPTTAQLQGVVTDAAGAPVAGAAVKVLDVTTGFTWGVRSDAQGRYTIRSVAAGPADLLLVRGVAVGGGADVTNSDGGFSLAGTHGRTVDLAGVPGAAVAGTVYGPDGTPVAGAAVTLWHEGQAEPAAQTVTADDGTYSFTGLTAGDRYTVSAGTDGGTPSSLAPSEPTVTPLFRAISGQTAAADIGLGE